MTCSLPGEDVEALWSETSYEKPLVNMDPERQRLYETCQRLGVGITVMKGLWGQGDLLRAELSPAGVALTPNQCIHYAPDPPGGGLRSGRGPDPGGAGEQPGL